MKTLKLTTFFTCFFIGFFLSGAEYGKITGTVVDHETNKRLIGADVFAEGTELRAGTDENGCYTIYNILPGQYNIIAQYIGYEPFTYLYIVVTAKETVLRNFRLRPTVVSKDHRRTSPPMLDYRKTQSIYTIRSEEIERLPVTTIDEIVKLQPGITTSDFGLHMRGGMNDEMIYYIDGIATKVPYTDWQYIGISPSVVQEIEIISGGFDVEYGDANSGIVNIYTKRGQPKQSAVFTYLGDEIFSGDKLNFGYNRYDLSLVGPIPMAPGFYYFAVGDFMQTDAFQKALYKIESPRDDYHLHGKISYLFPNARGRLTISGFKTREQYVVWNPYVEPGNDLKYFDNKPMTRTKNWLVSTALDYMLTYRTLASLNIGVTHSDRVYGNRDYGWEEEHDRKWYDDYRFKAEHLINYLDKDYREEHGITVRQILIDSLMQYHEEYWSRGVDALRNSPYGIEGLFYTYGDYRYWTYWHNNDVQVRFHVIQSIGRIHEFKTGIDFIRYNIKFYNNALPWISNPSWEYFEQNPYKLAGYLQDKINHQGFIARFGLRFDYFNSGLVPYVPILPLQFDSLVDDSSSFKISPRIGFSLPINYRMKIFLNYGYYYQFKQFKSELFTDDLQKTVMFELGYEYQFLQDVLFGFTAYFKDIDDVLQLREVLSLPYSFFQYYNIGTGSVLGFEFNLNKRMSDIWGAGISYNLQFVRGTYFWEPGSYYDHYNYDFEPSAIDFWLDHDERHTLKIHLDVECSDYFSLFILKDFTSSLFVTYHSGHPYTPEDLRGNRLGDINSERMFGYWNVDWKFSRRFKVGPAQLVFTGLINNLFNTKQIVDVYNTTGEPDDHGDVEPSIGQFGYVSISSPYYSPQGDYNHDGLMAPAERQKEYITARNDLYADPTNYNNPFRMRLGVGIEF